MNCEENNEGMSYVHSYDINYEVNNEGMSYAAMVLATR